MQIYHEDIIKKLAGLGKAWSLLLNGLLSWQP